MRDEIDDALCQTLRQAQHLTVLSGAGLSAECGVPTFRDALAGHWANYRPEELASFEAFKANPKQVWDWYHSRRAQLYDVTPHAGYFALKKLEEFVPSVSYITQNVDKLHQRTGIQEVIELHGDLFSARVTETDELVSLNGHIWFEEDHIEIGLADEPVNFQLDYLRPNIVWFGEPLPEGSLNLARNATDACDVMLIAGTSGLVNPAASLPRRARDNGALIIEINPETTSLSELADYTLRGPVGTVLPALLEKAWREPMAPESAAGYIEPDYPDLTASVLKAVSRYAALPDIHSVTVFPHIPRPLIHVLLDERLRRKRALSGQEKRLWFDINVSADYGEPWYHGIRYFMEGIAPSDLVIVRGKNAYVQISQRHAAQFILLIDDCSEEQLPDDCMWRRGDGYWLGFPLNPELHIDRRQNDPRYA